jgi:hypothetical protein
LPTAGSGAWRETRTAPSANYGNFAPNGVFDQAFAEKAKGSASEKFHKQKGLEACGLQPLLKLENKFVAESDAWKEWTILQPEIRLE